MNTEKSGRIKPEDNVKPLIIKKLRRQGCRITRQRELILDVILEEECSTIKEICGKSRKLDAGIGFATVYRMVSLLEQTGLVSRGIVLNYDEFERLRDEEN